MQHRLYKHKLSSIATRRPLIAIEIAIHRTIGRHTTMIRGPVGGCWRSRRGGVSRRRHRRCRLSATVMELVVCQDRQVTRLRSRGGCGGRHGAAMVRWESDVTGDGCVVVQRLRGFPFGCYWNTGLPRHHASADHMTSGTAPHVTSVSAGGLG